MHFIEPFYNWRGYYIASEDGLPHSMNGSTVNLNLTRYLQLFDSPSVGSFWFDHPISKGVI